MTSPTAVPAGSAATLIDRIVETQSAAAAGSVRFVSADTSVQVPWGEMLDEASAMAGRLQARGVGSGTKVGILGPTTRALVTAIEATWLAGATAVVLPLPMRLGSVEAFVDQTRTRIVGADITLLLVDRDLAPFVEARPGDPAQVLLDELAAESRAGGPGAWARPELDPAELAILQFTSGSTADPKGVMLPHRVVGANLDAMAAAAELEPATDVLVSWLPLYHDMGLIGLLGSAMTRALDFVLASPQDFTASPARWMEWMSSFGGTVTAGPNFSYALAARALRRLPPAVLDLSRWRLGLNGAEPVDPASVEAFCAAGAPQGLDPRAVFCAFGMAEATLAVTFPRPLSGMAVDTVDRSLLEHEGIAVPVGPTRPGPGVVGRRLARLGRPVPGIEIRIVEPVSGATLGERRAGELEIRGSSLTPGYYRRPEATRAAFHDGWLRTGDLAYLVDGELVVCGRLKDMIVVGGRNVFPEDVERAVAGVDGVRAGNVIAFGVHRHAGREGIVVVAEAKTSDVPMVREAVAERVRDEVGLPSEVVLVLPGSLPKTSSGKLQRGLCRSRYLEAELQLA